MNSKRNTIVKLVFCILIILGVGITTACNAQKVTRDASGNYIQTKTERKAKEAKPAVNTGKTFTDTKGVVYPVYQTERGKLYIIRKSAKTGKEYKQYLKVD